MMEVRNAAVLKDGDRFAQYRVEKTIGSGPDGIVYLVRHKTLDLHFALKVFFPEYSADEADFSVRFLGDGKNFSRPVHPNLVGVTAAGRQEESGVCFLVSEFVEGGSLRELLKKRKTLSEGRALEVVWGIAAALGAVHSRSQLHLDVRPENILFDADERPRLSDFGVASLSADCFPVAPESNPYAAPELQRRPRTADGRSDLYSLGVILYEMLAGVLPPRTGGAAPDIREAAPRVSAGIAELIADLCAPDPVARPQTAAELREKIDAMLNGSAAEKSTPRKKYALPPDEELRRRHRFRREFRLWAYVFFAAIFCGVLAAWLGGRFLRKSGTPAKIVSLAELSEPIPAVPVIAEPIPAIPGISAARPTTEPVSEMQEDAMVSPGDILVLGDSFSLADQRLCEALRKFFGEEKIAFRKCEEEERLAEQFRSLAEDHPGAVILSPLSGRLRNGRSASDLERFLTVAVSAARAARLPLLLASPEEETMENRESVRGLRVFSARENIGFLDGIEPELIESVSRTVAHADDSESGE